LDKIIDYDKCNPDQAKEMGLASYCKDLFKEQKFYFWSPQDLAQTCDSLDKEKKAESKDDCALLNDRLFGKYHEKQKSVLAQVQEFTKGSILKK